MRLHATKQLTIWLLILLLVVVSVSVLFTNHIARRLAEQERVKMELWAEATRQLMLADDDDDIDFLLQVIEGNTTIPVYMVDAEYQLLLSRNVHEPRRNKEAFYAHRIASLRESQQPIEVHISNTITQYIYYEDSTLLRQLTYIPYIELLLISAAVVLMIVTLTIVQRNEKNTLWAGLSKETAHQLGTPISSLYAWNELLKTRYPDDDLLPEMDEDIQRLKVIADRFSKVGSEPELKAECIALVLKTSVEYMHTRSSKHVTFNQDYSECPDAKAMLSASLFSWVVENLVKNAIDSMNGNGTISLTLHRIEGNMLAVDVTDTGKGIDRRKWKTVFEPGYTSKQRGWGLGLSLSKRIIEDYHRGKLFVKISQPGVGTTFRIIVEESI